MRVLFVNSVAGTGSTGRICTDLYDELASRGHDTCIAYGRGNLADRYVQYHIGDSLSVLEHGLESRLLDNHGRASRYPTRKFVDFIRDWAPDVINLHNIHGYYLNYPILWDFLKVSPVKIVWTFHDCWPFLPHSAYLQDDKAVVVNESMASVRHNYPKSWFINQSRKNYTTKKHFFQTAGSLTIVTPSNWLAGLVRKSFLASSPTKVIRNGIDTKVFYPKKLSNCTSSTAKKRILGVASYWDERKGLEFFIKLAQLTFSKYEIQLIGRMGPQQTKMCSRAGIDVKDHVESTQELADIYRSASVFINPTLQDNYPTTNIEALACGTPVITFDTGGSPEALSMGGGIITSRKSAAGILDALSIIESDHMMEWTPTSEALFSYSRERMVQEYISEFEEASISSNP